MLSFLQAQFLSLLSNNPTSNSKNPMPSLTTPRRRHRPVVCDHRLITEHAGPLKFHAASYLQLQYFSPSHFNEDDDDWTLLPPQDLLIASPYNHPSHLLDLSTLDTPFQLLAKAFTVFKPTKPSYATAPYVSSFNWQAVVELLQDLSAAEDYDWQELRLHVVIFRSRLNLESKRRAELGQLDQNAHREAIVGGGLLKYWFGDADEQGQNLATCIWRNKEDSKRGSSGKDHRSAVIAAMEIYEAINFKIVSLRIGDGANDWAFEGEGAFSV